MGPDRPVRPRLRAHGLIAAVAAVCLGACGSVGPSRPPPETCWFAHDVRLGFQGRTTLGDVGMGGPTHRWDGVPVYAWITQAPVDLLGTGELTRAICAEVDGAHPLGQIFEREAGSVVWNSWPPGQMPRLQPPG